MTFALPRGGIVNGIMRTLDDLNAARADLVARHACLLLAVMKHAIPTDDPDLVDRFLTSRGVSRPVQLAVKAAVAPLDLSGGLAPSVPIARALLAAVDRTSVLGQLGAVKVPSLTNAGGAAQTVSATAYWLGESVAAPPVALGFAALSLTPRKVVTNVVVSEELLRMANADTLALLERATVTASAAALDTALLDPANAGTADVKPASLTNGVGATAPLLDFANQVGQVLGAISGGAPSKPVLVVSLQNAVRLATMPSVTDYVKVIVSPAAGAQLIAIDASGVAYADDGGSVDVGSPDMQLDSTPTTPSTAATVMTSTWQRNLRVVRCARRVSWAKRADAVAVLTPA